MIIKHTKKACRKKKKGVPRLSDSLAISNNILRRAFNEGVEMSPMKLQKLLYFLYARYLHISDGDHLFSSRFEVWKYGPVLQEVYRYFKNYSADPILEYAEMDSEVYVISETVNPVFKRALDEVWQRFKGFSGQHLSAITHLEHAAWFKADQRGDKFLTDEEIRLDGDVFFA